MPIKNPTLDMAGVIEDPSYAVEAASHEQEAANWQQAGKDAGDIVGLVAAQRVEDRQNELLGELENIDDVNYNRLLEENAAVQQKTEELTQQNLSQIPEARRNDPAIQSFTREMARKEVAKSQGLLTEADYLLQQGVALKNAIRRNPRLANELRSVATTVGGYGRVGPEVDYLFKLREEQAQQDAQGGSDWLSKMALQKGWGQLGDYLNNPAKFMADSIDNYTLYQQSEEAKRRADIRSYDASTAGDEFRLSMRERSGYLAMDLQRNLLQLLKDQTGEQNLENINAQLANGGTIRNMDIFKQQVPFLIQQARQQIYNDMSPQQKALIPFDVIQNETKWMDEMASTTIDTLGSDKFFRYLDNMERAAKLGFMWQVGPNAYYAMDILSKLDGSVLGQAELRDFQRVFATALKPYLDPNTAFSVGALLKPDGTVNPDGLGSTLPDLEQKLGGPGVSPETVQKGLIDLYNYFSNPISLNKPSDQVAIESASYLVGLSALRSAGNRIADGRKLQSDKVTNAMFRMVGSDQFLEAGLAQTPEVRAKYVPLFNQVFTTELKVLRQDLGPVLAQEFTKPMPDTKNVAGVPPNEQNKPGISLGGPIAPDFQRNPADMARPEQLISLQYMGAGGQVRFVVNPPDSNGFKLNVGDPNYQAALRKAESLNRTYSEKLTMVVRAHANALALNAGIDAPDYALAFDEVKNGLLANSVR